LAAPQPAHSQAGPQHVPPQRPSAQHAAQLSPQQAAHAGPHGHPGAADESIIAAGASASSAKAAIIRALNIWFSLLVEDLVEQ
jgi:hypothetical protein